MIYLRPMTFALRKLCGSATPDVSSLAVDRWVVSPGSVEYVRPAIHLPDQLDRIRSTEFVPIDHVLRAFKGDFEAPQEPTRAYRIADIDLVDGVLFGPGAQRHLRPRGIRTPAYRAPRDVTSGAMYESWNGNRWFGVWLHEDCLTYRLAEAAGAPVATSPTHEWWHRPGYEARLGMAPRHVGDTHFDELILFDDLPNNAGKVQRARDMRRRLLAGRDVAATPGVFLLRRQSGEQRLLLNELEIAERFATELGFVVLDPSASTLDEIVAACGQARVVAGVEGSQLVHGLMMMPEDAVLLAIQPPDRVAVILKTLTDRQGQTFAFVVGQGGKTGFTADWEEIRRTLDSALTAQAAA